MKVTNASLPYPVWGLEDDYKTEIPEANIEINKDSDDKYHKVTYNLKIKKEPKEIIKLIEQDKAILSYELDCIATFNREAYPISKSDAISFLKGGGSFTISIDKKKYYGNTSITPFITAIKSSELENKNQFNDEYGDLNFIIEPGDVIAVFPIAIVNTTLNWKNHFANAGAPVVILEDKSKKPVIHTVLTQEKIQVLLPPAEFKNFKENFEFNSYANPIILMSLGRPAIMTALEALHNTPSDKRDWAEALKLRISGDEDLKEFWPENGDWDNADLSNWDGKIEEITSLIFKGAEKKMFSTLKQITKHNQED